MNVLQRRWAIAAAVAISPLASRALAAAPPSLRYMASYEFDTSRTTSPFCAPPPIPCITGVFADDNSGHSENNLRIAPLNGAGLSLAVASFAGLNWGKALSCNGANIASTMPLPASPKLDMPEGFSVSTWVKPDVSVLNATAEATIVAYGSSATPVFSLAIVGNGAGLGKLRGRVNVGGAMVVVDSPVYSVDTHGPGGDGWIQVALVFDGVQLRLYQNGAHAGSSNWSFLAGTVPTKVAASALTVCGTPGNKSLFKGLVDRLHIARGIAEPSACANSRMYDTGAGFCMTAMPLGASAPLYQNYGDATSQCALNYGGQECTFSQLYTALANPSQQVGVCYGTCSPPVFVPAPVLDPNNPYEVSDLVPDPGHAGNASLAQGNTSPPHAAAFPLSLPTPSAMSGLGPGAVPLAGVNPPRYATPVTYFCCVNN